jgi:hypothetical protein
MAAEAFDSQARKLCGCSWCHDGSDVPCWRREDARAELQAAHKAGVANERGRHEGVLRFAIRTLCCHDDAANHGGMWCSTRAALPGHECGCDHCKLWRALCRLSSGEPEAA